MHLSEKTSKHQVSPKPKVELELAPNFGTGARSRLRPTYDFLILETEVGTFDGLVLIASNTFILDIS
jgi:hypothetical protein